MGWTAGYAEEHGPGKVKKCILMYISRYSPDELQLFTVFAEIFREVTFIAHNLEAVA